MGDEGADALCAERRGRSFWGLALVFPPADPSHHFRRHRNKHIFSSSSSSSPYPIPGRACHFFFHPGDDDVIGSLPPPPSSFFCLHCRGRSVPSPVQFTCLHLPIFFALPRNRKRRKKLSLRCTFPPPSPFRLGEHHTLPLLSNRAYRRERRGGASLICLKGGGRLQCTHV